MLFDVPHIELRENLGRVGAQLKKNFMESVRQTWQAVTEFAASHRSGSLLFVRACVGISTRAHQADIYLL